MSSAGGMIWQAARLWLLLSLAALLMAILLAPAPTRAGGAVHHAGLVVRDGDGRVTYAWVPFPEETIDGIALLKRSGIPVVTVGFGGLGEGVCSIAGQGCEAGACRRTVCQGSAIDAPYWQYFRQDPADRAHWIWQPLGASATTVHDGDIFGWSWTGREPHLPGLAPREIASLAGAGDGAGSVPAARTYLPEGVAAALPPAPPDVRTTAAATGIIVTIGIASIGLVRHRRTETAA